jgi:hypothetical protein
MYSWYYGTIVHRCSLGENEGSNRFCIFSALSILGNIETACLNSCDCYKFEALLLMERLSSTDKRDTSFSLTKDRETRINGYKMHNAT